MIVRLVPWLLVFAFGFFVGMMVFQRRDERPVDGEWEKKCRELEARCGDLTRRLGELGGASELRVQRLRSCLREARAVLTSSGERAPERLQAVLEEIEAALNATA